MSTKRDPTSLSQGKYWVFPADPGSEETTIKKIDASLFLQKKTQSCSWKSDLLFFFFFPQTLVIILVKRKTETQKVIVIPSNHAGSIWQTQ